MRVLSAAVVALPVLCWGAAGLLRRRQARSLQADRVRVIKDSLERARAKQDRQGGGTDPRPR